MLFSKECVEAKPHQGYDIWNAIDGNIISQYCPEVKAVLDFGSGYGRLELFLGMKNEMAFIFLLIALRSPTFFKIYSYP